MALFTENWKIDILTIFLGTLLILYFYIKRKYNYWNRKGFKSPGNISFLFGHFKQTFFQNETFPESLNKLYKSTCEPFIGIFVSFSPVLVIRCPKLIQTILIKDFSYFGDRGIHCNEDYDPISANIFSLPAHKWKSLRKKLSPTFTTGRLKEMFPIFNKCGEMLKNHVQNYCDNGELMNISNIFACHGLNVISSVAFGFDIDTLKNEKHDFRVFGLRIFATSIFNSFRRCMFFLSPEIMELFRVKAVDAGVEQFLKSMVKQNLENREKNHVIRKDFFQLLVQIRNNSGNIQSDNQWNTEITSNETEKSMTFDEITANVFIFIAAGYETSASAITFCMYELAKNQNIQEKLREEIDRITEEYNGEVTYESLMKMKYLDNCINGKFIVIFFLKKKTFRIENINFPFSFDHILIFLLFFLLKKHYGNTQ